jgi:hypothetical protein
MIAYNVFFIIQTFIDHGRFYLKSQYLTGTEQAGFGS